MLSFAGARRVFVARGPQGMRRGIDSLVSVVLGELGGDPYAGDCFVFIGRDRRRLKVLE
jgi:transposase